MSGLVSRFDINHQTAPDIRMSGYSHCGDITKDIRSHKSKGSPGLQPASTHEVPRSYSAPAGALKRSTTFITATRPHNIHCHPLDPRNPRSNLPSPNPYCNFHVNCAASRWSPFASG